ncbi:MAG: NADH-quinone oxidoreductase subunit NuoG [Alphaproteobacteria bacterium]|nr:NADH-quinone oxidoreductase subunit NuoG [Alphaproteobacteria bacterium]
MPKLKIDGIELEVAPGTSILQAAEQLGIEIPRFCYHDRLSVPANCRMCLVEVEGGPPKPQASCALACAENMVVKTNSEMVQKARKGVMEMLLINHPLDCPICDQGGECDLQDQAVAYGFDRSRYSEDKRAVKDKELGPLVKTVMTRCIQCTRCVRFADEVAGTPVLGYLNRSENAEIGTFVEQAVNTELSGNLIDICPVGALTSKPYAFQARPWELKKTETIDVHDAVGANIRVDARGREVLRILPRLHEDVNEEWIDDKTRFAHDGLTRRRLDRPWMRDAQGHLRETTWEEALMAVATKFKATRAQSVAALAGNLVDVESVVALKDIMTGKGSDHMECRIDGAQFDASARAGYVFNSGISGIDAADAILLVGTNPRMEAALINARIRKNWLARRVKVGVIGPEMDLTYPTVHVGSTAQDLAALVAGKHEFGNVLKGAQKPMIIVGMGAFQGENGAAMQGALRMAAEALGVVKDGWNGFNVLHNAAGRVGALDVGFWSAEEFDLGAMDFVWLLGADDFDAAQISDKAFVIYQGHHGDVGAHRADVILPGCAYTEKNALYVNTEGRVQMARKAVDAPGMAREDWTILRAFSEFIGKVLPYNDQFALRNRIREEWPHFAAIDSLHAAEWTAFGGKGQPGREELKPSVANFYMTNTIARASATMGQCVAAFYEGAAHVNKARAAAE